MIFLKMKNKGYLFAIVLSFSFLVIIVGGLIFSQKKEEIKLVQLSVRSSWLNTNQRLQPKASKIVEKLILDAQDQGICLVVTSGYRTFEEQTRIKAEYGDLAEKPGKSEHHTGLAVDFAGCPMTDGVRDDMAERLELIKQFKELPEYRWLVDNADKYGIRQSYPHEPWHWILKK